MILSGDLERLVLQDIVDHEGRILWPYCDSKGFVTIGIGHLLPSPQSTHVLDLYHEADMRPATPREKEVAWYEVKGAYERGKGALAYKGLTDIRMSAELASDLCRDRLATEFMPALARVFPQVAGWPFDAIRGAVDIAYNCGAHCFDGDGWPNFVEACHLRRWDMAAVHCLRADARRKPTAQDPEGLGTRNIWTIARFSAAHAYAMSIKGTVSRLGD